MIAHGLLGAVGIARGDRFIDRFVRLIGFFGGAFAPAPVQRDVALLATPESASTTTSGVGRMTKARSPERNSTKPILRK